MSHETTAETIILVQPGSNYYEDVARLSTCSSFFTNSFIAVRSSQDFHAYARKHYSSSIRESTTRLLPLRRAILLLIQSRAKACFAMPGIPTLALLILLFIFRRETTLIVHNQKDFAADKSARKKLVVYGCIFFAKKLLFFSDHVAKSWKTFTRSTPFQVIPFPYLSDCAIDFPVASELANRDLFSSVGLRYSPFHINIFLWGRFFPYKGYNEFARWVALCSSLEYPVNLNVASNWQPSQEIMESIADCSHFSINHTLDPLPISNVRILGACSHAVSFPYIEASQSGAVRDSVEAGHMIMANETDSLTKQLENYSKKLFFNLFQPNPMILRELAKGLTQQ